MTYSQKILAILFAILLLPACIDKEVNVKNIDTDIQLLSNGMMLTVGSTDSIFLTELIDTAKISLLHLSEKGMYGLQFKDSILDKNIRIEGKEIDLVSQKITPLTVNFKNPSYLPSIQLEEITQQLTFSVPYDNVSVSSTSVNNTFDLSSSIAVPQTLNVGDTTDEIVIGTPQNNQTPIAIDGTLPQQVKRVVSIDFTPNSIVEIEIVRESLQSLRTSGIEMDESIEEMTVTFPTDFVIEKVQNSDVGEIVNQQTTFRVSQHRLNATTSAETFRFRVKRLSANNATSGNKFSYNQQVVLEVTYKAKGRLTKQQNFPAGYTIALNNKINIKGNANVDAVHIETQPTEVTNKSFTESIAKRLDLSNTKEVKRVNTITFDSKDGKPSFTFKFSPIVLPTPFELSQGEVEVQLPQLFDYDYTKGIGTFIDPNTKIVRFTLVDKHASNYYQGAKEVYIKQAVIQQDVQTAGDQRFMDVNSAITTTLKGLSIPATMVSSKALKSFDNKIAMSVAFNEFKSLSSEIETTEITTDIGREKIEITLQEKLDEALEEIHTIDFVKPTEITIAFDITNIPLEYKKFYLNNLTIQFPSFTRFTPESGLNKKNQLVLNDELVNQNGTTTFSKTITLQKVDFGKKGLKINDGHINLLDSVIMTGSINVPATKLSTSELKTVTFSPSISIQQSKIKTIRGKINAQSIDLNLDQEVAFFDPTSLPKGLDIEKLDIDNPLITLQIGNPLGIHLLGNIKLIGIYQDGTTSTFERSVEILPAQQLGTPTLSTIIVQNESESNRDLSLFLSKLPQKFKIEIEPRIKEGTVQQIDVSAQNNIPIYYTANIPLKLGKELSVNYTTDIKDIAKTLSDILKTTKSFALLLDVENTIPLDFKLAFVPKDKTGADIGKKIALLTQNDIVGGAISQPAKTTFKLIIKELEKEAVKELDNISLNLTVKTNSTKGGQMLLKEQMLKATLKIQLPDGIIIDSKKK